MRRLARENVFKLIFEYTFYDVRNDKTLELLLVDNDLDDDDKAYIQKTYDGVISHFDDLKQTVSNHLEGYVLERVYRPDFAVLMLAAYELSTKEVPTAVIINEAVNLAKKFGEEKSGAFVNGVLAKIVKDCESTGK